MPNNGTTKKHLQLTTITKKRAKKDLKSKNVYRGGTRYMMITSHKKCGMIVLTHVAV